MKRTTPLSPQELVDRLPATEKIQEHIEYSRKQIWDILTEQDKRLLVIVGPCSIHNMDEALEYATRLLKLQAQTKETLFLVMRTYFEKPRTSVAWKGFMHDPHLNGSHDITTGLIWTRKLLIELATLGMPTASEYLDPVSPFYFGDLISWGCIGARTTASPIHRHLASGLQMPIGFKNPLDGHLETAIDSLFSALHPHTYLGPSMDGKISLHHTSGNPFAHLVLRGSKTRPNYSQKDIAKAFELLHKKNLPPQIVIDCSHGNSQKRYELQPLVFQKILENSHLHVRGLMLESYLSAGAQKLKLPLKRGISITDGCMGWETTEQLLLSANQLRSTQYENAPCSICS